MPTIVTSDLQMSEHRRDDYRWDFVEKTLPRLIDEHEVSEVYVLGDCTENKDRHSAKLVNRFCACVYNWSQAADVYLLEGNHDRKDYGSPFFEFVKYMAGVRWISQPALFDGRLFLPHTRGPDYWNVNMDGASFIFAHNIFDGVTAASGTKLRGFPLDVFPKGARVYSGDVHDPQVLQGHGVKLEYVGAPFLCDFGDEYEPRVLLIEDNGKVRSLPVLGRNKRLVQWSLGSTDFKFLKTCKKGDIVKLRVRLPQKDAADWQNTRIKIMEFAERDGVIVDSITPEIQYAVDRSREASKATRRSDADYVRSYVAKRGVAKPTLEAGLDLIGGDE